MLIKCKTLDDIPGYHEGNTGKIIETYKWKTKGSSGLEIMTIEPQPQLAFKCDKGSFGHSFYSIIDKIGKNDMVLSLYKLKTERSYRYGYNQPRTYLDIDPKFNYSMINNMHSRLCEAELVSK